MPDFTEEDIERSWASVDRSGDGCWPFGRSWINYGAFSVGKRRIGAHRVSFFLTYGWSPPIVRHTCDWRPCVRPAHLLGGTQSENILDAVHRGRYTRDTGAALASPARIANLARGERHHKARLTEAQVAEIRRRTDTSRAVLAREFGVTRTNIYYIQTGRTWAHGS